jgi:hypothetical protein
MVEGDKGSLTLEQFEAKVQERIKELKYVPESDLLAVKKASEGLQLKYTESETSYRKQLDELQSKHSVAEAKAKGLEDRLAKAVGAEEHEKIKLQLDATQKKVDESAAKTLQYRKQIVAATYGISPDTVKDKTIEQLDALEEALKVVGASKGAGNFAIGGNAGGGAKPETPHERALRIIQEAEEKRGYKMTVKQGEKS